MMDWGSAFILGFLFSAIGASYLGDWIGSPRVRTWVAGRIRRIAYRTIRYSDRIEFPGMTATEIRYARLIRKTQCGYVWHRREIWRLLPPR